jgi:hypothetical protein
VALLTDDWVPYADVKLAVDGADQAWVVFEDRRGQQDMIQVGCVSPDGQISRSTPWPGTAPDVAGLANGAVVVLQLLAIPGFQRRPLDDEGLCCCPLLPDRRSSRLFQLKRRRADARLAAYPLLHVLQDVARRAPGWGNRPACTILHNVVRETPSMRSTSFVSGNSM